MTTFPILQFGTGRFLQAHVDLFVSQALARGAAMGRIAVVRTTSDDASRLRLAALATGEPYFVQLRGLAGGAVVDDRVEVSSIGAAVDANTQWDEVERLFLAARCVVSNTADRGYETDPADRPEARPPKSLPAKLAALLTARFAAGAPPITFFPCELIAGNGGVLRGLVLSVLETWRAPAELRRWAAEDCVWVNSLVDRIVSQPLAPVGAVAEPYALWAIEAQPGLTPPCAHPDIVLTDDLRPYERLKLFILNLGHSYLAELWSRSPEAPNRTVREALADRATRTELDDLYDKEVLPVFDGIGMAQEALAYRGSVIDRFLNPFLDHRLKDIFINHEAKKQRRFGGIIELAQAHNLRLPQPRLAEALASGVQRQ